MTKDYSRVPKAVFDVELDVLTWGCLKQKATDPTGVLTSRFKQLPAILSDLFMVAPKLTFKVTGSNVPLAVLVDVFGADTVEQLLVNGDLEFILWRDFLGIIGLHFDGLIPFMSGKHDAPEWCEPEASNARGLEALPHLSHSQRARLSKLATERTTTTDSQRADGALDALKAAHRSGCLGKYGAPGDVPLSTIDDALRMRLVMELVNLQHAAEVIDRELDLYDAPQTWDGMLLLADEVNSSRKSVNATEAVFREERAPSAGQLVSQNIIAPSEVIKLRDAPEARAFREWLWTRTDPADTQAILGQYRNLIARDKTDLRGNGWYRLLRVVALQSMGVAADFVAGGGVAGIAASTTISLGDEFLALLREHRSPRRLSRMLRETRDSVDGSAGD